MPAQRLALLCAFATALAWSAPIQAQPVAADPLQRFAQNRDQPLRIDGRRTAWQPAGNSERFGEFGHVVRVTLGDVTITSRYLTVHYDDTLIAGDLKTDDAQRPRIVTKLEPSYDATVTYQGRSVRADDVVLDMRANRATLDGDVVVKRDKAVTRGGRLTVDLASGLSRMEPTRPAVHRRCPPQRRKV
jgi:lipopolysaccharide export system protein LptA